MNNEFHIPTWTIGKIAFFDNKINCFGMIKNVLLFETKTEEKVYFSDSDIVKNMILYSGDNVLFLLNKNKKGYIAQKVQKISSIDDADIISIFQFLPKKILFLILSKNNYNIGLIISKLDLSKYEYFLFEKVIELGSENNFEFSPAFFETICNSEMNIQNLYYFFTKMKKECFFQNILDKWPVVENIDTIRVLGRFLIHHEKHTKYIKEKNIKLSPAFCVMLKENLTRNERVTTYHFDWAVILFKHTHKSEDFLNLVTFKAHSDQIIQFVFVDNNNNDDLKKSTRQKFVSEVSEISIDILENIFYKYSDTGLILSIDDYFDKIKDKEMSNKNITHIVYNYTNILKEEQFTYIVNKIEKNKSFDFIDFIIKIEKNESFLKIALSVFFEKYSFNNFKFHLESDELSDAVANALFKFENFFCLDPIWFFREAYKRRNDEAIIKMLKVVKFSHYNALVDFVNFIISDKWLSFFVEKVDNNLTAFIKFIYTPTYTSLKFVEFCNENIGFAQIFAMKYAIYSFFTKSMNRIAFLSFLESIEWTDISSIIVKNFIQKNNSSIDINDLSVVFKSHFNIISTKQYKKETFLKTFLMKDILPLCNGRKKYDAIYIGNAWEITGSMPKYIKMPNVANNCGTIFCEGRFWKTGNFYTKTYNKFKFPRQSSIGDFYWCRGDYCAKKNNLCDTTRPFYEWTLLEIAQVFNIQIQEEVVSMLSGWVNRMNEIVERLFCRTCKNILRPKPFSPKKLGFYAVPVFECVNSNCIDLGKGIRFTHCNNSKCNNILDSRECESCKTSEKGHIGLKCNKCGEPCPKCSGKWQQISVE